METVSVDGGHLVHYCGGCQWRRQRGVKGGSFPHGWTSKNYVILILKTAVYP